MKFYQYVKPSSHSKEIMLSESVEERTCQIVIKINQYLAKLVKEKLTDPD